MNTARPHLYVKLNNNKNKEKLKLVVESWLFVHGKGKENLSCDSSEYWRPAYKTVCVDNRNVCHSWNCPYSRSHMLLQNIHTHTAEANGMIISMTVLIIYINIYTYISKHDKQIFICQS